MNEIDFSLQPRQSQAILTEATEILYGGAAGGGKSHMMRIASIWWCFNIPRLQIYLFRRTYPELALNHLEGPSGYLALLEPLAQRKTVKYNESKNFIKFYNGSKIHLCHCQHEKDVYKFQGAEIHVLLIDEATHFTPTQYKFLRARVRMVGITVPKEFEGMFPRIMLGSNPGGTSHNYFKKEFVTARPYFKKERMSKEDGEFLRQYIPARLTDNKTLLRDDPTYASRLKGLGSPALVKAMLEGNWDIIVGGAFDDLWNRDEHVIKPFHIPHSWYVDRSFDWGEAKPFSVLWFAEADGSEVQEGFMEGWCPPKGTLIVIGEWYGSNGEPNVGLRLSATEIAEGIKEREKKLKEFILGDCRIGEVTYKHKIFGGPADNSIYVESNGNCVAKDMERKKVYWTKSNKAPGSRKAGLSQLRARLKSGLADYVEEPALYFFDTCKALIEHLPVLPRDPKNPEDVETNAEDHDYDALRYRALDSVVKPFEVDVGWPT